jgi:prepilin-type N-terminal cleavage/methylation domain-containing protein
MFQHPDASKRNKGFTLIEALVALTLLTVGLIPAFLQASSSVKLAGQIRNSLIAAHLAQEGAEVVRSLRDANWFVDAPFDTGLTDCSTGCQVQYDDKTLRESKGTLPLKLDPLSGLYQYATGTPTPFSRKITITGLSSHELKVISEVAWLDRDGSKTFSVEYHLFDWLQ